MGRFGVPGRGGKDVQKRAYKIRSGDGREGTMCETEMKKNSVQVSVKDKKDSRLV